MVTRAFMFLVLLAAACQAQIVTTYDSRFGVEPVASAYRAVDIGNTSRIGNPDYQPWFRAFPVPALVRVDEKVGVTITGTVEQAEAELERIIDLRHPSKQQFVEVEQQDAARSELADKAKNEKAAAKYADLVPLWKQIEALIERVEALEQSRDSTHE